MKKIYQVVSTLAVGFVIFTSANASTPLQNLQQKLSSFRGLQAHFQQALFTDKRVAASQSSGKMLILRPGKFRWETHSPNQQILVADGNLLWIYDVDLEQATKQKLDTTDSNSPALFLSGDVSEIPKRFTVSEEKAGTSLGFKLTAKASDDMFQSIKIYFQSDKLSKMIVDTRIGQRSEFNFSQVVVNPHFPSSTFNFKPPVGVDVLRN